MLQGDQDKDARAFLKCFRMRLDKGMNFGRYGDIWGINLAVDPRMIVYGLRDTIQPNTVYEISTYLRYLCRDLSEKVFRKLVDEMCKDGVLVY